MAYVDIYDSATTPDHILRKQFSVAIHNCAVDILNEDPSTENHANRIQWAKKVTQENNSPVLEAERWVWKLLENATIQSDPLNASDNDVQFVANSLANTMANGRR